MPCRAGWYLVRSGAEAERCVRVRVRVFVSVSLCVFLCLDVWVFGCLSTGCLDLGPAGWYLGEMRRRGTESISVWVRVRVSFADTQDSCTTPLFEEG